MSRGLCLITSHLLLSLCLHLSSLHLSPSLCSHRTPPHLQLMGSSRCSSPPRRLWTDPISATRLHDYFYSVPQVPWWITLIKWYLDIFSCTSIFLKPHPKCMCLFVIKVSHISFYILPWNIISWLHRNKKHIKHDTGLIRHYGGERCEMGNIW